MAVAVILGSAFKTARLGAFELEPMPVHTEFGNVILHRCQIERRLDAFVVFRHGLPHRYLPHQIPYQAHCEALGRVGCRALLVTSSVGVLDPEVPLNQPLLVDDLLMPDNRLPDGSACTMFRDSSTNQGHLVLDEGLFSTSLKGQLRAIAAKRGISMGEDVIFAHVGGPRTKTRAENHYWREAGAQVNSMTVGPEVVLANELEIPTAALVVGHKYSSAKIQRDPGNSLDTRTIQASLNESQKALQDLVVAFLQAVIPPPFGNRLFRFGESR